LHQAGIALVRKGKQRLATGQDVSRGCFGLAAIHANSVQHARHRLEDLIGEVSQTIPYRSIKSAINLVAFIEPIAAAPGRRVPQIYDAAGSHNEQDIFREVIGT
jgi:Flp pilus assembly CpaF family ATPase